MKGSCVRMMILLAGGIADIRHWEMMLAALAIYLPACYLFDHWFQERRPANG